MMIIVEISMLAQLMLEHEQEFDYFEDFHIEESLLVKLPQV
jgi:hypothetical protein